MLPWIMHCQSNERVVYAAQLLKWNSRTESFSCGSCLPAALPAKHHKLHASAQCACGAPRDAACNSWGCLVHRDDGWVEMVFKWKGKRPARCYLSKTGCCVLPTALKQDVGFDWSWPSEQWWWILWSSLQSNFSFGPNGCVEWRLPVRLFSFLCHEDIRIKLSVQLGLFDVWSLAGIYMKNIFMRSWSDINFYFRYFFLLLFFCTHINQYS